MPQLQDAIGGEMCEGTCREECECVSSTFVKVFFLAVTESHCTSTVVKLSHASLHISKLLTCLEKDFLLIDCPGFEGTDPRALAIAATSSLRR